MPDPTMTGVAAQEVLQQNVEEELGRESQGEERELSSQELKNKEIKKRALHESKVFFEKVELKTQKILIEKSAQLETILNRFSTGHDVSETEIRDTLGLTEKDEVNDNIFKKIQETLHECKPEGALDPRFEVFKKRLEEKASQENRMKVERQEYDEGRSWFHVNEEGQRALKRIEAEYAAGQER